MVEDGGGSEAFCFSFGRKQLQHVCAISLKKSSPSFDGAIASQLPMSLIFDVIFLNSLLRDASS